MSVMLLDSPIVPGLTDAEQLLCRDLFAELFARSRRNRLRSKYYDAKQTVRHLGIAVPPQLESVETVIGWPQKAVDDLEQRTDLEGFVIPGGDWKDFGLDKVWDDNRIELEASQAHTSAYKYAVTFVAVLAGDKGAGEPEVLVRPLSATSSTALWDANRRRVSSALSVTQTDNGVATEFILYTDENVVTAAKADRRWRVERVPHGLKRCPVAVLPFKPSLESPFGKSRISRAVMSITDRAIRTLLRMEVSAEFYSAPQRYILGANEDYFVGPEGQPRTGWEVMLGKILAVGRDDEDALPQVGQFAQMTMQPHVDMVRSEAALFSGETGIPVNSLGIVHDNPSSEAAMQTAYLPLVKTAERAQVPFGLGWVDAMKMAVQLRDGLDAPDEGMRLMRAKFRNPATSTRTEAANATALFLQNIPWAAESAVALEMFGIEQTDIERLMADKRRAQVGSLVQNLAASVESARRDPAVDALAGTRGSA